MKSLIVRTLFTSAIIIVTAPLFAGAAASSVTPEKTFEDPAPFALKNPDVARYESPDRRRAMEVITGQTALGVLQNMKARHREHFEKAAAQMRARGYTMTSEVVVVRQIDLQARNRRGNALEPVSDSYANSDGEVIFWSWDDGDNSTWEGTMYVGNYQNGGYTYIDGQIDTVNEELTPVWEDTVYYYGGSGGGCYDCPQEPIYQTLLGERKPIQLASLMSDIRNAVHNELEPAEYHRVGSFGSHLRSWGKCFVVSCGVSATTCRWAGPAWAKCSLAGCGASAVLCGVVEMF